MSDDFHSRQAFFCPQDNIKDLNILVIGCGAIGRNVASNVARLGVGSITLVDGDIVEPHNVVPQNWLPKYYGKPKVEALAEEIEAQVPNVKVIPKASMWSPGTVGVSTKFDAVWTTVDNIDVRSHLYNFYVDRAKMLFDVRIGGSLAQVLTIDDTSKYDGWYEKTLFPSSESARFGCVQPMSNFLANVAAGISVNQFVNKVGGKSWPVQKMICYCAITSSLSIEDPNEYFREDPAPEN